MDFLTVVLIVDLSYYNVCFYTRKTFYYVFKSTLVVGD